MAVLGLFNHRCNHFAVQRVPSVGITEEGSNVNQQVLDQCTRLVAVTSQQGQIVVELLHLSNAHPTMNATR